MAALGICVLGTIAPAAAQAPEITPLVGYRFGGDPFEILTSTAQDLDGAAAGGVAADIPLGDGLSLEILYTRQSASIVAPAVSVPLTRVRATTEYWHAGGLQELMGGAVRPFLTGTLGFTRFAVGHDSEVRFSIGGGGGVKLRASDHVAVRLDGRLFVTFMDGSVTTLICSPGRCLAALHLSAVSQADFTAGLAFAF